MLLLARCGIKLKVLARRYHVTSSAICTSLVRRGYHAQIDHKNNTFRAMVEDEFLLLLGFHSYADLSTRYCMSKDSVHWWAKAYGVLPGYRKIHRLRDDGLWITQRLPASQALEQSAE